jgi:hypothetical protein
MADIIRTEDLDVSDEEKKLIVRAISDKAFRESLERQVTEGAELSDADLENVAGGVGSFSAASIRGVLSIARSISLRIEKGADMLCFGGG